MKPNRKELQTLVAKIEGQGSDTERLRALDDIFRLRNESSTPGALRAFYGVISQEKILRLTKLAVQRSVTLSPDAEHLMDELAAWAKEYDPHPDLVAAGIRRGNEADVLVLCMAVIAELKDESESTRCWLTARLKTPGKDRMKALAEVFLRQRGTERGQHIARVLFNQVLCPECFRTQKESSCGCGCKRYLCQRCAEIDGTTKMILSELAQAL